MKLLTKILAFQNNNFPGESGFIPSRHTPDQTHRIIDLISVIQSNWVGAPMWKSTLLKLDLHKAFDSVTWEHLYYILGKLGFGSKT